MNTNQREGGQPNRIDSPSDLSPAASDIFWRDEILQVMYWMLGEGLGDRVTAADLGRFLDAESTAIARHLARLAEDGDLELADERGSGFGYRLTVAGAREGARRFADEFSDLQFAGHGECNRAGCECQRLGPGACLARAG